MEEVVEPEKAKPAQSAPAEPSRKDSLGKEVSTHILVNEFDCVSFCSIVWTMFQFATLLL